MAKVLLIVLFVGFVSGSHWDIEEKHHAPQPYKFGYEVKDKEGSQHRHESGDGHGNVKGSYGYTDHKGLYREVHYIADKNGFRAVVKTNEPGTANQDPAAVEVKANPPHHHEYHHGHHHSHEPHHHVHNYNNHHDQHYNHNYHPHVPFIGYHSNYFAPLHGFSYNPSRFHDYGHWPFMDNKYSHFNHHHHNHHNYNHHQKSHHHHQPHYIHQYSSLHDHKGHSFNTPKFQHLHGFNGFGGLDTKLEGFSKFGKESVDDFLDNIKGLNSFNHEEGFDGLNINADLKDGNVKSWRYGQGNF